MQSAKTQRARKKESTRQTLKQAAQHCFARDGWHGTSVGSIAQQAGVAHGTFYVHFPTKEALMDELLAEFNGVLAARLTPLLEAAPGSPRRRATTTFEPQLRAAAKLLLDYWSEHRDFVRAYAERMGGSIGLSALRDGINPPAEQLVRSQLERLLAGSGAPPRLAALAAQGLLALWLRIALQAVFNQDVRRADAVEALTRMTIGAVDALRKQ